MKKKAVRKSTYKPRFGVLRNPMNSAGNQSIRTTVIYSDQFTLDPASAGVTSVATLAANGLYDPFTSGGGHQPAGFDQYMQLYNEYLVIGSTIKVLFDCRDATNDAMIGIFLEDFSTTDVDFRVYIENGNGTWTGLANLTSGSNVKTLKHKADISYFSKQDIANEDSFTGTSSTNPDDTHYYHIVVAPVYTGDNLGSINCTVEIKYDVIFRDPAKKALS